MDAQIDRLKAALVDRYDIDSELGAGGMANVYLALDFKHGRSVAIKVLRPELAAAIGAERFLREIQLTARLRHPHILPLLDSGEADGLLYYVMPLVEGESLRDRLNRETQLPVADAIKIAVEVADALNSAHKHDVIHRDIKPENILLEDGHAVVADFGIARAIASAGEEKLTETGLAVGTPAYMSPEQAGGATNIDSRSDIYSLGCVMYEMLAGETPFTGPTARAIIASGMVDPVPSARRTRDTISPAVDAAVTRALAKVPADRFASAIEFSEALSAVVIDDETQKATVTRPTAKRILAYAAGVVVIAVALTAGWNQFSDRPGGSASVVGERALTIVSEVDGSAAEDIRDAARGLVSAAIDQSAVLRTLPVDQIRRGMVLAGMDDTTRLVLQKASELAFRGSIRTVVVPTIDQIGSTYAITVRVVDADSGTVVALARENAEGEDELVNSLDNVVLRLRRDLGERRRDIQATRRLRAVATPSLDAYRLFARAVELRRAGDFVGSINLYLEALQHDPEFASVMRYLSTAYGNLGVRDSALLWMDRAGELSERLSPVERLEVQAFLEDNFHEKLRIRERIVREFQIDHINYGGVLSAVGRYEEAVAVMQDGDAANPFGRSAGYLFNWAQWLLPLGRFDEARRIADRLTGNFADMANTQIEGAAAQWAVAKSLAVIFMRKPDVQIPSFYERALVILASAHAARGRIHEAIETLDRATQFYVQEGLDPSGRAPRQARFILAAAIDGGMELAVLPRLASDTSVNEQRLAALWDAWAGDTLSAATYLTSAEGRQEMPAGGITSSHAQRLLLRARVAVVAGRWEDVIRLLEPVAAPTFARGYDPPFSQLARWTIAEAYEQTGDLDSAAAYFGLIASYEGFGDIDQRYRGFVHSFAHRRLAMVYTKLGDFDRAEEHWLVFLDNFTDPDPEVQWMVDEARAELERLGRGR